MTEKEAGPAFPKDTLNFCSRVCVCVYDSQKRFEETRCVSGGVGSITKWHLTFIKNSKTKHNYSHLKTRITKDKIILTSGSLLRWGK